MPLQDRTNDDGLLYEESTLTIGDATYGGQVYRHQNRSVYAVYLPADGSTGILRWFNHRTGVFEGDTRTVPQGRACP